MFYVTRDLLCLESRSLKSHKFSLAFLNDPENPNLNSSVEYHKFNIVAHVV